MPRCIFQTFFSCIKSVSFLFLLAIFCPRVFVFLLPRWTWPQHLCCRLILKCCSPLLLPCHYSVCVQRLPPCQLSETVLFHSLVLSVTHHDNKCVHSFEDCHHGCACLSNFPSRIVMPSNHLPAPPTAAVRGLGDETINSIIVLGAAFAVSILTVTPERQLQPPGQLLAQRGCHKTVLMLGDWDVAAKMYPRMQEEFLFWPWILMTLEIPVPFGPSTSSTSVLSRI